MQSIVEVNGLPVSSDYTFFTNNGFITAKELKVGDKILGINGEVEILNIVCDMNDFRCKTFEILINIKEDIQQLASFIQNDFERMYADGTIDFNMVNEGYRNYNIAHGELIEKLEIVNSKIKTIFLHYLDDKYASKEQKEN